MYDPITERVIQILKVDQEIFVPLDRLYQTLQNEGIMGQINIEMFKWFLISDERFELIDDLEDEIFGGLIDPDVNAELEGLAFSGGHALSCAPGRLPPST